MAQLRTQTQLRQRAMHQNLQSLLSQPQLELRTEQKKRCGRGLHTWTRMSSVKRSFVGFSPNVEMSVPKHLDNEIGLPAPGCFGPGALAATRWRSSLKSCCWISFPSGW